MNNSFTEKTRTVLAVQSTACCEKKKKNVSTVLPLQKHWNVWPTREFFNSERVTISFLHNSLYIFEFSNLETFKINSQI